MKPIHASPQPMRGGKPAPVSPLEDDETEHPRAEEEHRAGKGEGRRYPSPRKGRRAAPARNIEELFKSVQIKDTADDDDETAKVLDLLHTATELVEAKAARDAAFDKSVADLPLLQVGDVLKKNEVGFGFRVKESDNVCMNTNGDVKIIEGDWASSKKDSVKAVIIKYQTGFAWTYWSNDKVGKGGKTLAECLRDYGTATKKTASGFLVKGVFLTNELSSAPGKFFTLAVMKDGDQGPVKQQEEDDSVYRVFRSCVPAEINDAINLHQLVNIRNQNQGKLFWEM